MFDYCADGFNVENTATNVGTLKVHYNINLANCKITFEDCASLQVVVTLRGTNGSNAMNIFTGIEGVRINASLSHENIVTATGVSDKKPQLYTFTITFKNILTSVTNDLGNYKFTVIYTFNVEEFSSFYAQIHPSPVFYTSAKITGVN